MARNNKFSSVFAGVVVIFAIFAGVANAEVIPSMFATEKACWSAVLAGEGAYKFYVPKYLGGNKKDPVNGTTKVAVQLPATACVEMNMEAGKKWVAQPEGSEFRFNVKSDGDLEKTPYARHDCGNKVHRISYPTPEPTARKKEEAVVPAPVAGYRVGNPCTAIAPDGKPAQGVVTQVFADGGASCDAIVEVLVPSKSKAFAQYVLCTSAGAIVGYKRSGPVGILSGGAAGATGTYLGREIGGENWGWAGCVTGPAVGAFEINLGDGKSTILGGSAVAPPTSGSPVSPPTSRFLFW